MTEKLLTNKKNGMAMLLLFLAVIAAAAVAIIVGANLHLPSVRYSSFSPDSALPAYS